MKLYEIVNNVRSKNDFVQFIKLLKKDLKDNPDEWENADLTRYLSAMAAWVSQIDGYYINMGEKTPADISWNVFANILMAAKIYE
ncbi:DUF7660 family protein [Breznakiella homolactica]|uniref:DUF7660 domain-containing protein n=1 Tax=Breznakiella homolactica TaxID=2798577 RepID=A0A7T8BB41_9SPIR|nr:hypothetical protein [Breznakiella homolactica]QQO08838.1 hypothetical protein JFL75_18200 [Breznakiella homolactica]